jgi:digeranylgeranylglycerophospholipid reductase
VLIGNGGSEVDIGGSVFVAADGVESRIAFMAGINTTLSMNNVDSGCQYLMDELDIDDDLIKIYLGNDIAPGGYAWLFPKSGNSAHIGLAVVSSRSKGKNAKWYLDRFVSSNFPGRHQQEIMMGGIPAFHPRLPLVRGNLTIVGDAARLLDSLSGAGISNAMISGSIAGRVAAQSLVDGSGLEEYPKEFMKLKSRELYAYRLLRSIFIRAEDSDFEKVVDALDAFFPDGRLDSLDMPKLALRLLLKNPSLLGLARYVVAG